MAMLVTRDKLITALCVHLRTAVPELNMVKPYHGELDRYSKKVQLKEETFPAVINMTTPFALVVSKNRTRLEQKGASLCFRHDVSIYVGESNLHDFNNQNTPTIFDLLNKCLVALHGQHFVNGAGVFTVESDGEYLLTTDLFTVYDQKYHQLEIGT